MFRGTGFLRTHRGTDYSALIHDSGSSRQVTVTELFEGKQKKQKPETKQMRSRSWKSYLLTRIFKNVPQPHSGPSVRPKGREVERVGEHARTCSSMNGMKLQGLPVQCQPPGPTGLLTGSASTPQQCHWLLKGPGPYQKDTQSSPYQRTLWWEVQPGSTGAEQIRT